MNDSRYDAKWKAFLKKTGEELRQLGQDVREEAQRIIEEVKDPARQQQFKTGLHEFGVWAKKAADDVATLVETGVKQAEEAFHQASERAQDFGTKPIAPAPSKRKPAGKKPAKPKKKAPTKKPLGRKPADKTDSSP